MKLPFAGKVNYDRDLKLFNERMAGIKPEQDRPKDRPNGLVYNKRRFLKRENAELFEARLKQLKDAIVFNLPVSEGFEKNKGRELYHVVARGILAFYLRNHPYFRLTWTAMGKHLHRDHTTLISAVQNLTTYRDGYNKPAWTKSQFVYKNADLAVYADLKKIGWFDGEAD